MKDLIPFELENGTVIHIETEESDSSHGMQRVGRTGETEEKTAKRFSEALAHVKPAAEMVLNLFTEINTPAEIGLDFGVKFSTKLGTAIIASADAEATFKVSLKWKNPDDAEKQETQA